jgi:signal transduction histidine kinase
VTVSDRGDGFDPGVIFERTTGTGFGLLSIRERLSMLGGRLTIESEPGKGTRVTIITPHTEIR